MKQTRRSGTVAGSIRIIGGKWRRRRIAVPASLDIRPTPDRVRETLFNWLGPWLPGAQCLDLFAGTGALAFEALSRGAGHAVLVERDAAAAAALEALRATLDAAVEIVRGDALTCLDNLASASFDIAFVDPPYALEVDELLAELPRIMKPGGCVYLERSRDRNWPTPGGYEWQKIAKAGAVSFGLATLA
jgi:16S rRNA (guanine966-N2)-methyltransferase